MNVLIRIISSYFQIMIDILWYFSIYLFYKGWGIAFLRYVNTSVKGKDFIFNSKITPNSPYV